MSAGRVFVCRAELFVSLLSLKYSQWSLQPNMFVVQRRISSAFCWTLLKKSKGFLSKCPLCLLSHALTKHTTGIKDFHAERLVV